MPGFFDNVEMGPTDPILGVAQAFRVCLSFHIKDQIL